MDVVLAPNPGFMTGPGTNQYLRGDLLIDVAPYDTKNARRLGSGLAGRRLSAIVLTHIHPDHVGGAAALRAASGAPIAVHRSRADFAYAGSALAPERLLGDGVEIVHAGGRLRAVHTPPARRDSRCARTSRSWSPTAWCGRRRTIASSSAEREP